MARRKKQKKRDLSHHERYAPVTTTSVPTGEHEPVGPEATEVRASAERLHPSGEGAYIKRELLMVLIFALLITALFFILYFAIGKTPLLDSFIAGLKIN